MHEFSDEDLRRARQIAGEMSNVYDGTSDHVKLFALTLIVGATLRAMSPDFDTGCQALDQFRDAVKAQMQEYFDKHPSLN